MCIHLQYEDVLVVGVRGHGLIKGGGDGVGVRGQSSRNLKLILVGALGLLPASRAA